MLLTVFLDKRGTFLLVSIPADESNFLGGRKSSILMHDIWKKAERSPLRTRGRVMYLCLSHRVTGITTRLPNHNTQEFPVCMRLVNQAYINMNPPSKLTKCPSSFLADDKISDRPTQRKAASAFHARSTGRGERHNARRCRRA